MAPARGLALAAAQRVVDGVHGHTAGLGPHALPAAAAGLADLHQLGLGIADLADGAAAVDGHPTHLGGGQAQGGEVALLGHELDAHAGAAGKLAPAARPQLHVVDGGTDRDVAEGQGVAGADLRPLPALQHVAHADPVGRQDVALLPVDVVEQGDAGVAVGVVLDGRDLGGNAVLVPPEVHDAVLLLVATAAVARRLAAVAVAAAGLGLGAEEALLGSVRRDVGEVRHRLEPPAGTGGLALAKGHGPFPPVSSRTDRCGLHRQG